MLNLPPIQQGEELIMRPGLPLPLGAYLSGEGVQFAVFSRHASRVWLLLFFQADDPLPGREIELDPRICKTGDIWHIWIKGLCCKQLYAFRAEGPYRPLEGHRFNRYRVLLDPYATALSSRPAWDFMQARGYDIRSGLLDLSYSTVDNAAAFPRCILTEDEFDWEGDRPLRSSWEKTIIYEIHVRGLTVHSSSEVGCPGTFRGVVEKIPYFLELGITALELLPIQEFNEHELEKINPLTGEKLRNYWGYSTIGLFAPKGSYCSQGSAGEQVTEFKQMVKALHQAGIEVILDIVLTHSAEGNELGPTISFRGWDNNIFYLLEENRRYYKNYSGCGNTLNCNHPVVHNYIIDCLRYWVIEMHVDGFRFDLASIMGRDEEGNIINNPPLLSSIAEDPILRDSKLIAEAWDAAGAYQVGTFPGQRWSEWNGHYRDDIRRFWRGDPGMIDKFASRLCGSADIYHHPGQEPLKSINYITCHDGFTLRDLVSYERKHNLANGEENSDGYGENYSCNYGWEGSTPDPAIRKIRIRQMKNFFATLLLSRGVPMILGGDEFGRTQGGNNNAYCQDNETSWYDWRFVQENAELVRFVSKMIDFRTRNPVLMMDEFYSDSDIAWFNHDRGQPDWGPAGTALACMINGRQNGTDLYLMFNAGQTEQLFYLPAPPRGFVWKAAIDTIQAPPADICSAGEERTFMPQDYYPMAPRSLAVLISQTGKE